MIEEPIELKAYTTAWLKTFEEQSALLKINLGEYIAAVHHIGSTAIPSIRAKPIVDIAVESSVYPPSDLIANVLNELGFSAKCDGGIAGRRWFSKGVPRAINLHWCPINGIVVQSQVSFRDALRADIALAKEYQTLKKTASYGRHIDSAEYAAAKDNFIKSVLSR